MSWLTTTLTSSIGQKFVMALTGLFLISFLIVHLGGNALLLYEDPTYFNQFSHFMATTGIIRPLEVGLFAGFILHIIQGILLANKNRSARGPERYYAEKQSGTYGSRFAIYSGLVVLAFLVMHIYQFWITSKFLDHERPMFTVASTGQQIHDMYALAHETFNFPVYTAIYIIAFVLLGIHLNHGFQSAFQSLGLHHPKYTPFIKGISSVVALIFPVGFAIIAVVCTLR